MIIHSLVGRMVLPAAAEYIKYEAAVHKLVVDL